MHEDAKPNRDTVNRHGYGSVSTKPTWKPNRDTVNRGSNRKTIQKWPQIVVCDTQNLKTEKHAHEIKKVQQITKT